MNITFRSLLPHAFIPTLKRGMSRPLLSIGVICPFMIYLLKVFGKSNRIRLNLIQLYGDVGGRCLKELMHSMKLRQQKVSKV